MPYPDTNREQRILNEGRNVRLHRERIEILSKPWYASLGANSLYAATVSSGIVFLGFALDLFGIRFPNKYAIFALGLAALGWTFFALARRDKMWRELIRRESPELHRKLTKQED